MAASARSPAEGEDSIKMCCYIQDYDAILPTVASDEEERIVGMEMNSLLEWQRRWLPQLPP
jgi:hypothetical protein